MKTRCEGYRRHGGAFTLGPVTWEQCNESAKVALKFKQDGEIKTLPACLDCWRECLENKIEIIEAKPI